MPKSYSKNPRKTLKVMRVMTDPNPELVSIVDHGANQTPFNVVKANSKKDSEVAMPRERSIPSAEAIIKKATANNVEIIELTFDKSKFKNEKDASNWLEDKGFSEFTLSDAGNSFIMKGEDADNAIDEPKELNIEAGVIAKVAKVSTTSSGEGDVKEEKINAKPKSEKKKTTSNSGADKQREVVDTAKEVAEVKKELVSKFDDYLVYYSDSKDMAEIMDMADDGTPPGFYEITSAFYTALKNAGKDKDGDAAMTAAIDFAKLYMALIGASQILTTKTKANKSKETTMPEDKKTEQGSSNSSEKTDKSAEGTQEENQDAQESVKKAVTEAMTEVVASLKENVEKDSKVTADAIEEITKSIKEIGDRVGVLEGVSQTRKSDDVNEQSAEKTNKKQDEAESAFSERIQRSILGLR